MPTKYLKFSFDKNLFFFQDVPLEFNFQRIGFPNADYFKDLDPDIIIDLFTHQLNVYSQHYTRLPNILVSSEKVCKIGESLIMMNKDLAIKFYK